MKRIALSVLTMACVSSFAVAGGDMKEVEPAVVPVVPMEEVAEKNFYVGLGFAWLSTGTGSIDFFNNHEARDRTGNLLVLAGYEFNQYMALEGRYSTYILDEDHVNSDTWGIYVKPQYPVNEDFKVYALLGFGGMEVDGVNAPNFDMDGTGFQWGLGASYCVAEDIAIFVDYVSIANDMDADAWSTSTEGVDADAITMGVTYNF